MRAQARIGDALRLAVRDGQGELPVLRADVVRVEALRLRYILAARQQRRRERARVLEELVARVHRLHLAAVDDGRAAGHAVDLAAVVRDEQRRAVV